MISEELSKIKLYEDEPVQASDNSTFLDNLKNKLSPEDAADGDQDIQKGITRGNAGISYSLRLREPELFDYITNSLVVKFQSAPPEQKEKIREAIFRIFQLNSESGRGEKSAYFTNLKYYISQTASFNKDDKKSSEYEDWITTALYDKLDKAMKTFQPAAGSFATYLSKLVKNRVTDLYRSEYNTQLEKGSNDANYDPITGDDYYDRDLNNTQRAKPISYSGKQRRSFVSLDKPLGDEEGSQTVADTIADEQPGDITTKTRINLLKFLDDFLVNVLVSPRKVLIFKSAMQGKKDVETGRAMLNAEGISDSEIEANPEMLKKAHQTVRTNKSRIRDEVEKSIDDGRFEKFFFEKTGNSFPNINKEMLRKYLLKGDKGIQEAFESIKQMLLREDVSFDSLNDYYLISIDDFINESKESIDQIKKVYSIIHQSYNLLNEGDQVATADLFHEIKMFVDATIGRIKELNLDMHEMYRITDSIGLDYPQISQILAGTIEPMMNDIMALIPKLNTMLTRVRISYNPKPHGV